MPVRTALLVFSLLLTVMVAMYGLLVLPEGIYSDLIAEERPVEVIGALALLAASVLFFLAYREAGKGPAAGRQGKVMRFSLLLLAGLFMFGLGEELSWGQRLLGVETPADIKDASTQGELNVHNIKFMKAGWLDGDHAFQLFWLLFGVVIPVGAALFRPARRFFGSYLPIVPLVASAAFVANQALHDVAKIVFEGSYENSTFPLAHSLYETKESIVSVVFAVAAFFLYRRLKRPDEPRAMGQDGDVAPEVRATRESQPGLTRV